MKMTELKTISSVSDLIDDLRFGIVDKPAERWYRGQQDKKWKLEPSIFRGVYDEEIERDYIHRFQQQAAHHNVGAELDKWGWISFAQHHQIPTRLLDWSTQPLTALYFACCDYDASRDSKDALDNNTDAKFFILDVRKLNQKTFQGNGFPPLLSDESDCIADYHPSKPLTTHLPPIAVIAPLKFERITFQSGTFTLHSENFDPEDNPFQNYTRELIIPKDDKEKILEELEILGITETTLYRDLDRIAFSIRKSLEK